MQSIQLVPLQGEEPLFRDMTLMDYDTVSDRTFVPFENFEAIKNAKHIITASPEYLQLIGSKKDFKRGLKAAVNLVKKELNMVNAPSNNLSKRLQTEYKSIKPK